MSKSNNRMAGRLKAAQTVEKKVVTTSKPEKYQFSLTIDNKRLSSVVLDLKEEIRAASSSAVISYLVDQFLNDYDNSSNQAEILNDIAQHIRDNDNRIHH